MPNVEKLGRAVENEVTKPGEIFDMEPRVKAICKGKFYIGWEQYETVKDSITCATRTLQIYDVICMHYIRSTKVKLLFPCSNISAHYMHIDLSFYLPCARIVLWPNLSIN